MIVDRKREKQLEEFRIRLVRSALLLFFHVSLLVQH